MRAIITGIAGFIGSHVATEMLQLGWDVTGIDDLSGGFAANVPEGARFVQRDCCSDLDDLFGEVKPDVVVHLAAYAAEGLSHHVPNFNYMNNLVGTSNVLSAASRFGARHFVFTSSIAAYGHPSTDSPLTEATACHPCDPYGIAKLACEQHIAAFRDYYGGPDFTIFRPHNVFGPQQNISDPYRNVMGIFFRCAKQGLPFPVFGDGSQSRSFSYVDVVAKCIAQSPGNAAAKNQVFNVGGDRAMSINELVDAVAKAAGVTATIDYLPARKEVLHAHADHAKARAAFPDVYRDAIDFEVGLQKTAAFVNQMDVPAPTPCPAPIEIVQQLPPSWKNV
ncbi:NAD-dependent epimerase/dehydratase family protein [Rosistilla oblonga]|uniref:NAD-dependent epimerase/dehydratase family protein n=1 Tax=Rosistilla oblonga TaxID=2527990 RepID=UPI003A98268B